MSKTGLAFPRSSFSRLTGAGLVLALLCSGCVAPTYYPQAIGGHLKLMSSRQNVEEFLGKTEQDEILAERVRLALQALEFAEQSLYLPADGAYQEVAMTGREAVVWNVVATEAFSLEPRRWCFPVAGCVPYLGFYEQTGAERKASKLTKSGYDTTVSGAAAYSSLGWFDDPLLDTFLLQSESAVVANLFHELAHKKLYVKGDTAFSESFASFVEREGLRQWMLQVDQPELWAQWQERQAAREQFLSLLRELRAQLATLYDSSVPEPVLLEQKQALFSEAQVEYQSMVENQWGGRSYFKTFFQNQPNNADLALLGQYNDGVCAFAELYQRYGQNLQRFYEAAAEQAELRPEQRRQWLQRAC